MPSFTRRQLAASVTTTSIGLAGCLSSPSSDGDLGEVDGEWAGVGRDSGHTRVVSDGPADPGTVWTTELDEARAAGTPSIADNRVYVPVDAVSDQARHRYRLHALEAGTGGERWQVPLRSDPNASPAIVGDRIIVSARRSIERGRVVAFRERYGDEDWLYDIDARVTAPPTVDGTTVYVPDWEGTVHALSVIDGSVRWSRDVGSDAESRTFAQPIAVHGDTLYAGSFSGETGVIAVDAETGDQQWSRSTDVVTAGPVADDSLVAVRTHGSVVGFDTDGTERFTFNIPEDGSQSLALDDQHIYVPARGVLYAIGRDGDGEKYWRYELSDEEATPPTVVGETVLITDDGELIALARADGETQWTTSTAGSGEIIAT